MRCSNWEAVELSQEQLSYAASDAHVAVDLFDRLHATYASRCPHAPLGAQPWCSELLDCKGGRSTRRLPIVLPPAPLPAVLPATQELSSSTAVAVSASAGVSAASPTASAPAEDDGGAAPLTSADIAMRLSALSLSDRASLVPATGEDGTDCLMEIKSLAIFVKGVPLVAVLPADAKLDPFRLARHLQLALTSRRATGRQVRLATPEECVSVFGYRPGTVPPLGHRSELSIVLDGQCARCSRALLAGGGEVGTRLRIEPAALAALPACSIGEIAACSEGGDKAGSEPPNGSADASQWRCFMSSQAVTDGASEAPGAAVQAPPPSHDSDCVSSVPSRVSQLSSRRDPGETSVAAAAEQPRFLVDAMMGRLLRWLRVLGIDSLLRDEGEEIASLMSRAHTERRILLSRDRKLLDRRAEGAGNGGVVAVFIVSSDDSREQLRCACTARLLPRTPH